MRRNPWITLPHLRVDPSKGSKVIAAAVPMLVHGHHAAASNSSCGGTDLVRRSLDGNAYVCLLRLRRKRKTVGRLR